MPIDPTADPGRSLPGTVAGGRMAWLDNLKVVLIAAIIVAHAGMTYGAVGTWIYEEPSLSDAMKGAVGALIGVGVMFGLGLFFLTAGMVTTAPLSRLGPRRFALSRIARLGGPLLAYALVVWPVLGWLVERAEGASVSLVEYYRRAFSAPERWSLGTGPLWFVAILLVLTCAWCLWRTVRPAHASSDRRELSLREPAIAMAAVAIGTFLVRLGFPLDSAQFLDVHVWLWPQSAALFVLGAMGAERRWLVPLPDPVRRSCGLLAVSALVALAVMIVLSSGPESFKGGLHWEAAGLACVEGVFSVAVSLVVLDRFRRRHDKNSPLRRVLARSAYGAFLAQGPVLVLIALAFVMWTCPAT
jgi:Acyltransferase family